MGDSAVLVMRVALVRQALWLGRLCDPRASDFLVCGWVRVQAVCIVAGDGASVLPGAGVATLLAARASALALGYLVLVRQYFKWPMSRCWSQLIRQ